MAKKILVIDDEHMTVQLIDILLGRHGYDVIKAYRAEEGLRQAYNTHPDLILLDIMMPDMDGWEACRRLREMTDVPIIFLTAKDDARDIVKGLEMGANDYIVKPYNNEELAARIKAHLRRASSNLDVSEELVFGEGDFRVSFVTREVYVNNKLIHLTPKEFNLLGVLVRNAGRVITQAELVREAWGMRDNNEARDSLKLYIHYLRQKIEQDPQKPILILTSRGVGYRFTEF